MDSIKWKCKNWIVYFKKFDNIYWLLIKPGIQERGTECSRGLRGMLKKIPGNVREDSGECSRRFRGMLKKILGNLNLDLFCEVLLNFYQILQLNCGKTKEYFLRY